MKPKQVQQAKGAGHPKQSQPAAAAKSAAPKQAKQGLLDRYMGAAAPRSASEPHQKAKAATKRITKRPATPTGGEAS